MWEAPEPLLATRAKPTAKVCDRGPEWFRTVRSSANVTLLKKSRSKQKREDPWSNLYVPLHLHEHIQNVYIFITNLLSSLLDREGVVMVEFKGGGGFVGSLLGLRVNEPFGQTYSLSLYRVTIG